MGKESATRSALNTAGLIRFTTSALSIINPASYIYLRVIHTESNTTETNTHDPSVSVFITLNPRDFTRASGSVRRTWSAEPIFQCKYATADFSNSYHMKGTLKENTFPMNSALANED